MEKLEDIETKEWIRCSKCNKRYEYYEGHECLDQGL